MSMERFVKININDNVAVALKRLSRNEKAMGILLLQDVEAGHKFALDDIKKGGAIIKYGSVIGFAAKDIEKGEHVHTDNLKTALNDKLEYSYEKKEIAAYKKPSPRKINVYRRHNGDIGIRNELWVLPTVGCVNSQAHMIVQNFKKKHSQLKVDAVTAFSHPYGCSQTGEDHERTKKILQNICLHPNAGGVLVLGLGCENNQIEEFRKGLGGINESRIKFLVAQDVADEITQGVLLLEEIYSAAAADKRTECDISELKVGLKCGGSDGLSGITANPLLGEFSDYLVAAGASTVLTEVPEMFGAEHTLMARAKDKNVFDKIVSLINDFKDYYKKNGQTIYENPSPGNKAGGITTLEDKSLGCTQKGGTSEVVDVLREGEIIKTSGLSLLNGPGNDIVAVTNLGASGCHIILFTTGRGTPLGAFVPTVKVATNERLGVFKSNWIDFDASGVLDKGFDKTLENLIDYIVEVVDGKQTKNEASDSREIAIFKTGVTL